MKHFYNIRDLATDLLPQIHATDWYEWAGERYVSENFCFTLTEDMTCQVNQQPK